MKVPVMMTAEEMARQLWPGLNAVAMRSIEATFAAEVQRHLESWLRATIGSGVIRSAVNKDGKLQLLIEFDTAQVFGKSE